MKIKDRDGSVHSLYGAGDIFTRRYPCDDIKIPANSRIHVTVPLEKDVISGGYDMEVTDGNIESDVSGNSASAFIFNKYIYKNEVYMGIRNVDPFEITIRAIAKVSFTKKA